MRTQIPYHLRRTAVRPALHPPQWRPILPLAPTRHLASAPPSPPKKQSPTPPSPISGIPKPKPKPGTPVIPSVVEYEKVPTTEKEIRKAKPPQLVRPIGVAKAPQPGENSGVDSRSWAERKHDLVDYGKHKDNRAKIIEEMSKPYFRDFSRLSSQFKGKSWMAPSLLFRADKALHFPNLVGRTLDNVAPENSTTTTLFGNVSVVGLFSSTWAENQVATFLDGLVEEALDTAPALTPDDPDWVETGPEKGRPLAQRVDINVEENPVKAWLVRMFFPRLQRKLPENRWSRYFLVERGFESELKHQVGFWNQKVGYVYLVDWNCRIRWAGSGNAEPEEREALLRGVKKLVEDHRKVRAALKASEGEAGPEETEKKKTPEDPDDLI